MKTKQMKKTLLLIGCLLFALQAESQIRILGKKVPKVRIGKKKGNKKNNNNATNNTEDNVGKEKLKKMLKAMEADSKAFSKAYVAFKHYCDAYPKGRYSYSSREERESLLLKDKQKIWQFADQVKPAEEALAKYTKKYTSDAAYSKKYREAHWKAYQLAHAAPSFYIRDLKELLDNRTKLAESFCESMCSQANIDLMVLEYKKKPNEVTTMISDLKMILNMGLEVYPVSEKAKGMLAKLDNIEKKKLALIRKSRMAARFPKTHSSFTPAQANQLGQAALAYIRKNKRDKATYIKATPIRPWEAVRNHLGVILYYNLPVAMAYQVPNDGDEKNAVHVGLFYLKTNGNQPVAPFGNHGVAVGWGFTMYKQNLK
ncbi:hypothetical protein BKI52_37920 [marine bacterium AO1-C]|nr:hypothetical protein BKI52_37920 [marine bacterium AO1-C]